MASILVVAKYPEQRRQVRLFLSHSWSIVDARDAREAVERQGRCALTVLLESVHDAGFALRTARALRPVRGSRPVVALIPPGTWPAWTEAIWSGLVDCAVPWPRRPEALEVLVRILLPAPGLGADVPTPPSHADGWLGTPVPPLGAADPPGGRQ